VTLALLGAALCASACSLVPADDSATTDAGAAVCDHKGDCNSCVACANQNPCAAAANRCQQNAACVAVDQCKALCGADTACANDCALNNPAGVADYNGWSSCLFCQQCPSDCAGYQSCS